jgi:peptidyl-prolyl cis-trans isomerase SurA
MSPFKKVVLCSMLLSSLLVSEISHAVESLDRIVAVVNTSAITQQQLSEQIELTRQQWRVENKLIPSAPILRKQVLDHMIDDELQRQLAESSGLKLDEEALNKAIADIAKRNGLTVEQLRSRVEQEKLPYEKYRQKIREQLLVSRLQQDEVGQKITVSSQETTDMLAHMPIKSVSGGTVYHAEDLLIPLPDSPMPQTLEDTKKVALSLLQQAKNGSSFQQLIQESKNTSLALSGGDLGWRSLDQLPDIFQSAIQSSKQREIVGPVLAQNGFHLIRLLEVRGGNTADTSRTVTASHVRHILIKTSPLVNNGQAEKRLREIRAEILRGGSFANLAKKYSQDPSSAFKGGDLGWTLPGVFEPTFEAQMNKLSPKQISLPFRTQFGWHIVQILGRSNKLHTQSFSREQATQLVYQKKFQQALQNWLHQLRQQSYVKIM